MPIGSRYFLVKCSKLGKYSQNEIFLFWEWSILFVVSAHMGDLISERLLRPVCSFPNSSLAFLSQTIFQHFWGFSRNFQRGLGGSSGISLFSNNQRTQLGVRAKLGRKMAKWNYNKMVLLHISGFPIFGSSLPASCPL